MLSPWGGQRWEAQNGVTDRLRKTPAPVETRASAPPHDAGDVCSIQTSCFSEAYRQCQAALLAPGFDLLMNALAESEPANISLPVFWEEVPLNCHWWRRRSRYSFFTRQRSQPTGSRRRHVLALSRCQTYSASHLSDVARHLAECHVSSGSRDCLPCPAGPTGLTGPPLPCPGGPTHHRPHPCSALVRLRVCRGQVRRPAPPPPRPAPLPPPPPPRPVPPRSAAIVTAVRRVLCVVCCVGVWTCGRTLRCADVLAYAAVCRRTQ